MRTKKGSSVVQKYLGLVLKAVPYREADLMLTVFTRTDGLKTFHAYGARSMKSKVRAACQPFSLAEYEVYTRDGRYWTKEASVRTQFPNLQTDYSCYSCACLVLELTEKVLRHADDYEDLFLLVVSVLTALDRRSAPPENVLLFFLVRLVHLLGIFPALKTCSVCGKPLDRAEYWSCVEGGAVCSSCAKNHRVQTGFALSANLIGSFGKGQISSIDDSRWSKEDILDAVNLLLDYLRVQFELSLRTRKSLRL